MRRGLARGLIKGVASVERRLALGLTKAVVSSARAPRRSRRFSSGRVSSLGVAGGPLVLLKQLLPSVEAVEGVDVEAEEGDATARFLPGLCLPGLRCRLCGEVNLSLLCLPVHPISPLSDLSRTSFKMKFGAEFSSERMLTGRGRLLQK